MAIEKARLWMKVDTLANWMANDLPLGEGEMALVTSDSGIPLNMRWGQKGEMKPFRDLPNVIAYDQAAYVPPVGNTLPVPQNGVGYSILTEGTYNGEAIVVPSDNLGIASYGGGSWSVVNMPLPSVGLDISGGALGFDKASLILGDFLTENKSVPEAIAAANSKFIYLGAGARGLKFDKNYVHEIETLTGVVSIYLDADADNVFGSVVAAKFTGGSLSIDENDFVLDEASDDYNPSIWNIIYFIYEYQTVRVLIKASNDKPLSGGGDADIFFLANFLGTSTLSNYIPEVGNRLTVFEGAWNVAGGFAVANTQGWSKFRCNLPEGVVYDYELKARIKCDNVFLFLLNTFVYGLYFNPTTGAASYYRPDNSVADVLTGYTVPYGDYADYTIRLRTGEPYQRLSFWVNGELLISGVNIRSDLTGYWGIETYLENNLQQTSIDSITLSTE